MLERQVERIKYEDPAEGVRVVEDFIHDDSASKFEVAGSGTLAILANQLHGVGQIDTGAAADQDTSIGFGETNLAPGKSPYVEARVRAVSGLGSTGIYKLGIVKDSDELAQFEIDSSGNVKVTADGGTADAVSSTDTGEDVTIGTYYTLRVEMRADGVAQFYIDGERVYKTDPSVCAVASTAAYDLFIGIEDGGASQHKLDIDYIEVGQKR